MIIKKNRLALKLVLVLKERGAGKYILKNLNTKRGNRR